MTLARLKQIVSRCGGREVRRRHRNRKTISQSTSDKELEALFGQVESALEACFSNWSALNFSFSNVGRLIFPSSQIMHLLLNSSHELGKGIYCYGIGHCLGRSARSLSNCSWFGPIHSLFLNSVLIITMQLTYFISINSQSMSFAQWWPLSTSCWGDQVFLSNEFLTFVFSWSC
jgi:hypothetical protein